MSIRDDLTDLINQFDDEDAANDHYGGPRIQDALVRIAWLLADHTEKLEEKQDA